MGKLNWRAYFAEMIGVFTLCFVGFSASMGGADLLGVALAFGLAIGVMIFAFGAVSGGHFNPAVTTCLLMLKKISIKDSVFYIIFQFVGGILGSLMAAAAMGKELDMSVPGLVDSNPVMAIAVEAVLTFFLMSVILGAAVSPKGSTKHPGFAIGLTISMGILAGGGLTGAAMNPARFIGPAIASGNGLSYSMIYLLGPLLGAIIAGITYSLIHNPQESETT
jgi:aquaporin Z